MAPPTAEELKVRARSVAKGLRSQVAAERKLRRVLRGQVGSRYRLARSGPAAPDGVVAATALLRWSDLRAQASRAQFVSSGKQVMANVVQRAGAAGLRLEPGAAVLEFGCGGGRVIRHLRRVDGLRLVGCDVLADNVAWCKEHLPGIEFHQNELDPPLQFAQDGTFDLFFANSVFTHIPMPRQLPWIKEVARVLKPGGIAVVTVLGETAADTMMNAADRAEFEQEGEFTMDPDHPDVSASSAHIGSWDVFMSEARLRELYGSELEVLQYGEGFQVPVVLKRRA